MSSNNTVTLTRKELYDKVWSTPSSRLAKEFGFSDVALGKLCRKYDIPKPPIGYWARVQNGQNVVVPPLPDTQPHDVRIKLFVPRIQTEEVSGSILKSEKILVASVENDLHPLVAKTKLELESSPSDSSGICWRLPNSGLDVAVSKTSVSRAMRIWDALVKHLELAGYPVSILTNETGGKTLTTVGGEKISIEMRETLARRNLPLTEAEKGERQKSPWLFSEPKFEEYPSGNLSLKLDTSHGRGFRRVWSDSASRPLENQLTAFVAGLARAAQLCKPVREESEAWRKKCEEEERLRLERNRIEEEERVRVESLRHEFSLWQKCEGLNAFIAEVERRAKAQNRSTDPSTALGQWLVWAKHYVLARDPINRIIDPDGQDAPAYDRWDQLDQTMLSRSSYEPSPSYFPRPWWTRK